MFMLKDIRNKITYLKIISEYYKFLLFDKTRRRKMKEILSYDEKSVKEAIDLREIDIEERAMPGFNKYKRFYSKYMLGRYLFVLNFCRKGKVLDTGCGFGYGCYLLVDDRLSVVGIDKDRKVIEFARKCWKSPNLTFVEGSFLNLSNSRIFSKFDCVLGMETIEHLTYNTGQKYLQEIDSVLKPGGTLILSSTFPDKNGHRDDLQENPYHLHIFTKSEIIDFLNKIGKYELSFKGDLILIAKKLSTLISKD
jgi:2-polyprenyl-3-methyl-5-hydroxy-6-metoxy-1,4-benzoquinol methylase